MRKGIKGYEGLYQVNTQGQVISLSRVIINKNGREQYYPQKVLRFDKSNKGYCRVTLCKNHKTKRFLVHRLVAIAFVANPECKPYVNHKNNDPSINDDWNLEWCTHSENMIHAQKQNRLYAAQSKGGQTRGLDGERADKIISNLIGSQINNWKVISFAEYRGNKKYFNVRCDCGNHVTREQSYFMNATQSGCIKCKTRN
jgi:hypothetical protein